MKRGDKILIEGVERVYVKENGESIFVPSMCTECFNF
jgi:hypothetical protein